MSKQIFSLVSADKNAQDVRLLDSFNLSRRMSWVRANLDHYFREYNLDTPGNGDQPGDGISLIALILETPVGDTFEYEGATWERVHETNAWDEKGGKWLMVDGGLDNGNLPFVARVRAIPPNITIIHKGGQLKRDSSPNLRLVARTSN